MTMDAARVLAADVWTRARHHHELGKRSAQRAQRAESGARASPERAPMIRGLNSEEAVRRRLAKTAKRFKRAIDWMHASLVEISESAGALYQLDPPEMMQLVVIQAL